MYLKRVFSKLDNRSNAVFHLPGKRDVGALNVTTREFTLSLYKGQKTKMDSGSIINDIGLVLGDETGLVLGKTSGAGRT